MAGEPDRIGDKVKVWRYSRMLRLADGPDEVLARRELNRWSKRAEAETSGAPLDPRHPARMV